MSLPAFEDIRVAVVGLGYVGLPLAVYMAQHFPVVGFDIDAARIADLQQGKDHTHEVTSEEFAAAKDVLFSHEAASIEDCNVYIVTVPTPIDSGKQPDLSAVKAASRTVGVVLRPGDIVVYESTVYPGATEEVAVPLLEEVSGLTFNKDFYAGYSPERINPGDHTHRLPDIVKVTSGSTEAAGDLIDALYAKVITAGTHRVSSIRIAEAAKVIENIQRDVNVALINELAMLFKELELDTDEILGAAGTKWNFHPYRPGLVGGHCIGVDPYYLTHKAQSIGFHPEMILAGRRINDDMAAFVAQDVIKTMLKRKQRVDGARALILGFTFKENCPDTRNTKVADLARELSDYVAELAIYDPHADAALARKEYGLEIDNEMPKGPFDVIVVAVKHDAIASLKRDEISGLLTDDGLVYDIKSALPADIVDARI